MPKILFILLFCLSVIFPVNAQDNYQLREPTQTDYLHIASESLGGCNWATAQQHFNEPWDLCTYLINQIEDAGWDSLQNAPYELLNAAYEALQPATEWSAPGNATLWHRALIISWLRDYPTDLAKQQELTVADMSISVKPRDFNGDG